MLITAHTKKLLKSFLIFSVISMSFLVLSPKEASASVTDLPDTSAISGPYTDSVMVEIAQQGNGINLNAPVGWSKLSIPSSQSAVNVGIFDGCLENTWDHFGVTRPSSGYCRTTTNYAYMVEFIFCASDTNGDRKYTTIAQMISAPDCYRVRNEHLYENDWRNFGIPINTPAVGDYRHMIVATYFPYYSNSSLGNGRINRYRIRTNNSGGIAGFVGGLSNSEPNAVQSGYDSAYGNFNNNYRFNFGTPCNLSSARLILRWQDADHSGAGGNPADDDVAFTLRNVTTGQQITSQQLASIYGLSHPQFIGGQGDFRAYNFSERSSFAIRADHQYQWIWTSVQRNNGVQFWIPYDTSEYYEGCSQDDADCNYISLSGSGIIYTGGKYYVQPNSTFNVRVNMRNTGNTTWSQSGGYVLRNTGSSGFTRTTVYPPGNVSPGQNANFDFIERAPNISVDNPTGRLIRWQMRHGNTYFGESCSVPIYISDRYVIATPSGSSPDSTYLLGTEKDWDFTVDVRNTREGESRYTTTRGVVHLRGNSSGFRYTLNGAPISGLPYPTPNYHYQNILGNSTNSYNYTITIPSSFSASLSDVLCVQARVENIAGIEGGPVLTRGYTDWGTIACITAAEQGYLSVNNGSAWAGGNFDPSPVGYGTGQCAPPGGASNGFIASTNNGSIGAFADYVVGATGSIDKFGSVGPTLKRLMFANSGTAGNIGPNGTCITDLWTYLSKDTSLPGITELTSSSFPTGGNRRQQYVRTGNLNINTPQTIQPGEKITILVDGDVTISENITFANYSLTNKDQIPSFVLVVRGNINISNNVTELSGIYIARPDDDDLNSDNSNTGLIDTCYDAPRGGSNDGQLSASVCTNQLTVHGMFAANDIEFRRTYGGVSNGNPNGGTNPAEYFDFSPEAYLAKPFFVSTFEPNLPIDFLKDLPPVIN